MSKFKVGDKVQMPGVPMVVEVLDIEECEDGGGCDLGGELFKFNDPGGMGEDWMHSSEFELAS